MGGALSAARREILARVRRALADIPDDETPEDVEVPRAYRTQEPEGALQRFVERVADYGSLVDVVASNEIPNAVARACRAFGVASCVVPADLPRAWLPHELAAVTDTGLAPHDLDRIGAAVTGCALGIAETGTVVLDAGPRQGRRALTLVPDVHICVIEAAQIVDGVPAALRVLAPSLRRAGRPLTFVSGPSATSDIELARVEGVHGPRRFALIVVANG